MNNEASEYLNTTYATDARCVGSNPLNKNAETTTTVMLPDRYTIPSGWKDRDTGANSADTNWKFDYEAMEANIRFTEEKDYWFASRAYKDNTEEDIFYIGIRFMYYTTQAINSHSLCSSTIDGKLYGRTWTLGFRPCIKLRTDIKIISGDGASENTAYELGI